MQRYIILYEGKPADSCRFFDTIGGAKSSIHQRTTRAMWGQPRVEFEGRWVQDYAFRHKEAQKYEVVPVEITVGIIRPSVVETIKL